ncbi:OmpA family protein [Aestuariicoccus sp. MJ-SS9]|uniref:OmpA family protein n=1 Tax=Aestuariicoccus sp. MJ-SS9 TaxID=3079855 RepID=UPI0029062377|nr:OmpA family protein [Aestuariicoccus sp. MJ-SS9]MDU8910393.1 OmpA family protein [Aestuariicoccus sp. MJ-SS9]
MTHALRAVLGAAVLAVLAALGGIALTAPVAAGTDGANAPVISTQNTRTVKGERYIPGIWVDPDGCEHWVMDDGVEGYMSPHVDRKGIPVCRRGNTCGVLNSDQYFATDSYRIHSAGRAKLEEFFRSSTATAFIIAGHTDSRASDSYNMRLSFNRATSVAKVARATGARIADVRGYGERMPAATNSTVEGMAKNRRVEIICIR